MVTGQSHYQVNYSQAYRQAQVVGSPASIARKPLHRNELYSVGSEILISRQANLMIGPVTLAIIPAGHRTRVLAIERGCWLGIEYQHQRGWVWYSDAVLVPREKPTEGKE